jgi:hypothetical protein
MRWQKLAGFLLLACAFSPARADATGAIEQIVPKNLTPAAGSSATFQVALTPDDNTTWPAGSYTLTLIGTDQHGASVATSPPFAGSEPLVPQQTVMAFVDLSIPAGFAGPLVIVAHLQHGTHSEDAAPISVDVAGALAAPPPGAAPAAGTGGPHYQSYTGALALNAGFAAQQTQSAVLNLSGKYGTNDSVTAAAGLANTTSNTKPVVTFQTPWLLTTVGTFAPSYERNAFAGPTGTGVGFKTSWDNSRQILQGAYISGNHDTTNPFEMEAVSYRFPFDNSGVVLTGGYENIYGPAQPGPFFLRNGAFFGLGDDVQSPHSTFVYGIHYGMTSFHDDISDADQFGYVFDAALGFKIKKALFAFTYERATPYFANASAPAVTPDRETETAAINLTVGVVQIALGANAYRDDLPGSTLLQTTHNVTENVSITDPLRSGDTLSFQAVNGVQHQTGDPVAPFSGNDGTTLAYTTKRGPYAIQYSLADTETRDNSGDLVHVITNGLTVARSPFAGVTISGGFNVNQNLANVAEQTTLSNTVTGSVSYTTGGFTMSTQINESLTHPDVGLAAPPTLTYNYGLAVKPKGSRYTMSLTVTEMVGAENVSVGAFSLNRTF